MRLSQGLLKKEVEMEWSSGKCSRAFTFVAKHTVSSFCASQKGTSVCENGVGAGFMVNIQEGESLPSHCLSPNTKPGDL